MRRLLGTLVVLSIGASALAAPNITNATQKGSLLIFPDIRIDERWNTVVRIQNDGSLDVDLKCFWMDGNKNRLDFGLPITRNQPVWFDARTGNGTSQINPFPQSPATGFDNPFLLGPIPPVQLTTGGALITGANGSFSVAPFGPTPVVSSPDGTTVVLQGTLTSSPVGPPDDDIFTTLTLSVTIGGVTHNVSQPINVFLGDGTGFIHAGVNADPGTEVVFDLPDGRRIGFTLEGAFATIFPFENHTEPVDVFARVRILNPEGGDTAAPMGKGLLACWAVDGGGTQQIKWNHFSGTATLHHPQRGAYEYNAYAFFAPSGIDLTPIGPAGTLNLNGVEYDSCPLYQIGQFTPPGHRLGETSLTFLQNRLALAGCTLDFRQDWLPGWTKLQFDVWNEDEIKFTGAFECADSWHETLFDDDVDSTADNFDPDVLGSFAARYRIQPIKSTQCEAPGRVTQAAGVLAVQSTDLQECTEGCFGPGVALGTTLAAAGKFTGTIRWDPAQPVPEGGIR
jgi:hypothetical protein